MTSQLNVDTIVDKAGTGGTNIKVGNTSTYVSDGGNVTQNTVQGLAKAWVYANGGAGLLDSLNVASGTDHGTGDYSYTLTNAFSSDNYVHNATSSTTAQGRVATRNGGRSTASVIAVETAQSSTLNDTVNGSSVQGDLA